MSLGASKLCCGHASVENGTWRYRWNSVHEFLYFVKNIAIAINVPSNLLPPNQSSHSHLLALSRLWCIHIWKSRNFEKPRWLLKFAMKRYHHANFLLADEKVHTFLSLNWRVLVLTKVSRNVEKISNFVRFNDFIEWFPSPLITVLLHRLKCDTNIFANFSLLLSNKEEWYEKATACYCTRTRRIRRIGPSCAGCHPRPRCSRSSPRASSSPSTRCYPESTSSSCAATRRPGGGCTSTPCKADSKYVPRCLRSQS